MAFKQWFKGKPSTEEQPLSVQELIVLERWDEAVEYLKRRIKSNPHDLHSHLKLAEVYTELRNAAEAVDAYVYVAEEYGRDGFFDKGLALLRKAARLASADPNLQLKIEAFNNAKALDRKRSLAFESFRLNATGDTSATVAFQRMWRDLAKSRLIQMLSEDEIQKFFAVLQLHRYPAGAVLASAGDTGDYLLLIGSGMVEAVLPRSDGGETSLRTFSSGDIIGESVLLKYAPWPAAYRATEQVLALRLDRDGLGRSMVGNPNPRQYLGLLGHQQNDRAVADASIKVRLKVED